MLDIAKPLLDVDVAYFLHLVRVEEKKKGKTRATAEKKFLCGCGQVCQ